MPHSSHSWWKSGLLGAKARWNNDCQPEWLGIELGTGREKQSHRLALEGKGLALSGGILGRLRGGGYLELEVMPGTEARQIKKNKVGVY